MREKTAYIPQKIYTKVDLYTQLGRSRSPNNVKHSSSNTSSFNLLLCRCGFLQAEVKILLQCLEDMDIADPSDGRVGYLGSKSLTINLLDMQSHC